MKLRLNIDKVLIKGFALLLLSTGIIIVASISESKYVNETARLVAQTQEVLFRSEKLLLVVTEAETGAGAFMLTGQPYYFQTFEKSKKYFPASVTSLRQFSADNPTQQRQINSMLNLVKHGGSVWAEAETEKGVCFYFSLPFE